MIPENVRNLVTWEDYPPRKMGGQSCGKIGAGVTLKCQDLGFEISIDKSRSQLENKEMCWMFFELFYSDLTAV